MSKRTYLPYTVQDLLPQAGSVRNGSITGSMVSASSLTFTPATSNSGNGLTRKLGRYWTMARRLFKPRTLDFETAMWEIAYLILNPKKLYSLHYYKQQQTANGRLSYARDDPLFLILLTSFLVVSAVAWGLTYSPSFVDILGLIVYMVVVDFYLTGAIVATTSWFVTNKLFNDSFVLGRDFGHYDVNYIEWGFCFDIHCNSFLVVWVLLYVVQYIILPLLRIKHSIFSVLLGNTLYFGTVGYYFVLTFYGYSSLPFINANRVDLRTGYNPAKVLQMIVLGGILPVLAIGWLLSVIFGFNVAETMVDIYFN